MRCIDCPYGKEGFEKYKNIIDEDDAEDYIYCNKIGSKIWRYRYCSDYDDYEELIKPNKSNKKKRNKRERYLKYKQHLKHLEKIDKYPQPVKYTDKVWIKGVGYVDNPNPYYKRLYRTRSSKYLKRQSNKAIRRYKGELHNGYQHIHKVYDFWWQYN